MAFALADTTTAGSLSIQHYTESVSGGTLHLVVTQNSVSQAVQVPPALTLVSGSVLPLNQYTTSSVTTGSIAAGVITGAALCVWLQTGNTPGAQLVRTGTQLFADIPGAFVGLTSRFRIINSGSGALTLTTDAGATVTLTGTMTVAQNTWREFILTLSSATTAAVQAIGTGTNS